LLLSIETFKRITQLILVFGSSYFGINALLSALVLYSVLAYIPNSYFSTVLIGYGPKEQVSDVAAPLVVSMLIGLGTWWAATYFPVPALAPFILGPAALFAYAILLRSLGAPHLGEFCSLVPDYIWSSRLSPLLRWLKHS
jgi:hypothetical protein